MVFNYPNGNPFKFLFLTRGMLDTLVKANIPLHNAHDLPVYHSALTYGELAGIAKYQEVIYVRLGLPFPDPKVGFGTGLEGQLFGKAFDAVDRSQLTVQFESSPQFQTVVIGQSILVVTGHPTDSPIPGFEQQEASTFSAAMLELIYKQIGFLDVHNGMSPLPKVGEFTLAEVLKLVSIENP